MKKILQFLMFVLPCFLFAQERPNIVFIFADDIGISDINRYHLETRGVPGGAPTPNIEALIDEGMSFTDAHSPAALCAPSRYAVMSGNYNFRSSSPGGIWGQFDDNTLTNSDVTIGQVVKREGYHTGFVGKWHFGGDYYKSGTNNFYRGKEINALGQVDFDTWIGNNPKKLGFNYDFTLPQGIQGPSYLAYENSEWYPLTSNSSIIFLDEDNTNSHFLSAKGEGPGDSNWNPRKINKLLIDKAVNFINDASSQSDPFFLYYSATSVHVPHAAPNFIDGVPFAGTTSTNHTDMIKVLDFEVKKIVDALKANGEYDNTIIVFTSDNGGLNYSRSEGHHSSGIYRGDKRDIYEGGHRIPLIVSWPCTIPAASTSDHTINGTDFVATFAALAGGSINSNEAKDSHNFLQLLLGDNSYEPRTEIINQGASGPRTAAIRDGKWKLIFKTNVNLDGDFNPTHLFNLASNISESESGNFINSSSHQTRKNNMMNRFIAVRNSSARTTPVNSISYNPSSSNCGGNPDCNVGSPCNDNDPCTVDDKYNANCNCVGTPANGEHQILNCIADNYVRGGNYGNENYGSLNTTICKKGGSDGYTRISYFKFDLRSISSSDLTKAIVKFTVKDRSSSETRHRLLLANNDNWQENTQTWNNYNTGRNLIKNFDVPGSNQSVELDITAAVRNEANTDGFITLVIRGADNSTVKYFSRQHATKAPELVLIYGDDDCAGSRATAIERLVAKKEAGRKINLTWAADEADKPVQYTIQHSIDGQNYTDLFSTSPRDNGNVEAYFEQHENPSAGYNYYRLKIDYPYGVQKYFTDNPIYLAPNVIPAFPNPTDGILYVNLEKWMDVSMIISIYNIHGVLEEVVKLSEDHPRIVELDMGQYQNGMYAISIKPKNSRAQVVRIVVNNDY